jgi:hypothetical protein
MNEIKIGSNIPAFTLPDRNRNLSGINSAPDKKNLVIYFIQKTIDPDAERMLVV